MHSKTILYAVRFFGENTVEKHIKNLQSDSVFSLNITKEGVKTPVHITGPKKTSGNVSLQELHEQLSKNAKKLGLDIPQLVENTKHDIYNAQTAEKNVLAGDMIFEAERNESNTGFVTLEATYEDAPLIEDIIDQYAYWRIACLANAMGMTIEGHITKNAGSKFH